MCQKAVNIERENACHRAVFQAEAYESVGRVAVASCGRRKGVPRKKDLFLGLSPEGRPHPEKSVDDPAGAQHWERTAVAPTDTAAPVWPETRRERSVPVWEGSAGSGHLLACGYASANSRRQEGPDQARSSELTEATGEPWRGVQSRGHCVF